MKNGMIIVENSENTPVSTTIRRAVINEAISYIFDHIDENMTVEDVARHCSYSKYHLTHSFDGGKYAIYHFKGFPQLLFMVYQEIFCRWLSRTGNQMDERPVLDIYRRVREDGYMEIDICFPLK